MSTAPLLLAFLLLTGSEAWRPQQGPLMSRFAAGVTPENAHCEYPRPQLVRAEWLNLNGLWDLAILPRGDAEPAEFPERILVPFPVESALSGVARRVSPEQTLWYRRSFTVPREWAGRSVLLNFEGVDWEARVLVNGREVGEHRGGYDPFTCDVSAALLPSGEQELLVAVNDPTDRGVQPRGKQVLQPEGIWYTPSSGIWRTVWLEPVPEQRVERLRLTPDLARGRLRVSIDPAMVPPGYSVQVSVSAGGDEVARASGGALQWIDIPDPRPWSPDDPFLYDLQVGIVQDGLPPVMVDVVESYFGMRSIALQKDAQGVPRLFLNGAPLFQLGTLDQGFWPDGLYTAPNDAALLHDLEVTKRLGFNMVRKHVKVEPRRWYHHCDRLGLLVWQDMPSGDGYIGPADPDLARSAESAAQFETELGRVIDALINHPCVVMWVPFNEGWGQYDSARICELIRARDPTRLVNAASGWTDRGCGDVMDLHAYPGPAAPVLEERRAAVLGEFGGLGLPLAAHTWQAENNWGYRSFPDRAALTDAYVQLLAALRPLIADGLAAAVYTQTTDVEIEVNGLMTYDRALIKPDEERVRAANERAFLPPPRVSTLVADGRSEACVWRYTIEQPPDGWSEPGFDDSGWSVGEGGFGREGTPGAVVRTAWATGDIWLRRAFTLERVPAEDGLHLAIHHDEDADVFLNGCAAASLAGYTTGYVNVALAGAARAALVAGANTLAIHCRQTRGGQYIDAGLVLVSEQGAAASPPDYPVHPVPFTGVEVADSFWLPRLKTNRDVTVWYDFKKCEETGRIDNFAKAGGLLPGEFEGIFFNDSDVFKVVEGASCALALQRDERLESYLDELIAKIAAAQEEDGYLYTARTLRPDDPPEGSGAERWSNLASSHELYNAGHLYEAAVAHRLATGKDTLLAVALRNADLLCRTFGKDLRCDVPGHQEVEIGLVKLFRLTGERRCLDLAKFFLDMRGRADLRAAWGEYCQDHLPVVEQSEAVGHAVRAGYMYSGMADVAALLQDEAYARALDRIWQDVVARKMYLTGGVGASGAGEAFGAAYDLPNASAYCETCAAIAFALWNERMFLASGDARYIDVLERVLYNGFLSGVSLSGDEFFYVNPLAADGREAFNHGATGRSPWFGCACCPVNVVRFLPAIPGFAYAARGDQVFVSLYLGGAARLRVGEEELLLAVATGYPWDGRVRLQTRLARPLAFELRLRVPGWARGEPVPSDLYRDLDGAAAAARLAVNGEPVEPRLELGFACLRREWQDGDVVELDLPLLPRRVVANPAVAADRGRVALERGPIVYCAEGVDHEGGVADLVLPDEAPLVAEHAPDLLGGVTVLRGQGLRASRAADGSLETRPAELFLVPYHVWAHRGAGALAVWLPRDAAGASVPPAPTLASRARASASHCHASDTVLALNDQIEPQSSGDEDVPRHTFYDHLGGEEWVQLDFAEPARVSHVEVYWFDDSGRGACRVPASWEILYDAGDGFRPVKGPSPRGLQRDGFNRATFLPVEAHALRLVVRLQEGFSGGVLEWRVR
ncbi:MAG: glycoside hydrolase family 127 protein [Planctomycetes bacterium]|nr:glycoside hydrolase family 127 protein [Planctomycetota bacterium]